jgi:hypothetical protein
MRLREALKDYRATYVLAEATLARMRLTDEAAVATTDANHAITGAVVACDKGLVVFTVDGPGSLQASVHAWRDVSPPELTATTEEKLEATVMMVQVRLKRPPIKIGTLPFDLGVVEWAISSTATAVDFWRACVEHAGEAG